MSQGEFDIIHKYFDRPAESEQGVTLGIGDDCAILDIPDGYQLVVTTDSLVSGVHFFEDVDPYRLGYKALAVNLSDIAAMGAEAKWVSLAITLPSIDEHWLSQFCRGFFALADKYNVRLIGGDTTKGPLSITVSAKGIVKRGQALRRDGARPGDLLCVSGVLGDGGLGLAVKLFSESCDKINNKQVFIDALELTEPRLILAKQLASYASSCIDISDGLSQDLIHILNKSQCHAQIELENLPFSAAMKQQIQQGHISQLQAWQFAVSGGDDYELLFTVPAEKMPAFQQLISTQLANSELVCYQIGKITAIPASTQKESIEFSADSKQAITFTHLQQPMDLDKAGWDHFK
ncbi:thiamine-phosphate kinase [Psychromonas sp. 14N.309.X.WAT.B.A12]|uniref:thiamine-phosphate kinase n=1 Tax=unclassified Psychromonas TaxID=2614957 RepID=UPI0025AF75D7|nr:thiamine-phosphate kinase [Psychromonas sp. 14N.309.X.WAT.B.A12]MDN2661773.1 thiamine-phosphate kinase [Psychromonas sp. 14N.309.X.WAT.B.A12]